MCCGVWALWCGGVKSRLISCNVRCVTVRCVMASCVITRADQWGRITYWFSAMRWGFQRERGVWRDGIVRS